MTHNVNNNINNQSENCNKFRKLDNEIKQSTPPTLFTALVPLPLNLLNTQINTQRSVKFKVYPRTPVIREESLSNIRVVSREETIQNIRIGYVSNKALLMQKNSEQSLTACIAMRILDLEKTPNWTTFNSSSGSLEALKDINRSGLALKAKNIELTNDLSPLRDAIKEFGPAILNLGKERHFVIIDEVGEDLSSVTFRDPDRAIMATMTRMEFRSKIVSPSIQLKLICKK